MGVVVGNRTAQNLSFLQQLVSCRTLKKFKLSTNDQLLCLIDCAINVLDLRFPLKSRHKNRLKFFAPFVRSLAKARTPRRVRQLVHKHGCTALRALLKPVFSAIGAQNG